MKYIITGSLGHISKPLAEKLVSAGGEVAVISSSADRKPAIEQLGATAAIGSVTDTAFLTNVLKGADVVYTMVPPFFGATDWKAHIASVGNNYAKAIAASGVKKVVNLSSIGAHMPEGCGPVSGLYFVEQALNALEGVDVKHIRPGFFYPNFMGNIGMIKHMGIIGGNYGEGATLMLADTTDIAMAVADEMLGGRFTGKSVRYVVSDSKTTQEVAAILGAAIGKPDLKWVDFTDKDLEAGMVQNGIPSAIAQNYAEMGSAMRSGKMGEEYLNSGAGITGATKLTAFAAVFATAYAAS